MTKQFDVHPYCVPKWKQQLLESAVGIFDGGESVRALDLLSDSQEVG